MVAMSVVAGLVMSPAWGNGAVDLLFLPAVLASALRSGLRPALFSALASALSYNYYFNLPRGSLHISSPADLVTVLALFLVATVASQLAASIRRQALLASSHAARNATIAGLARRLLSCRNEQDIAQAICDQLADLYSCNALVALPGDVPSIAASTPDGMTLHTTDRSALALTFQHGAPAGRATACASMSEWQFNPILLEGTTIAAVGLARDDGRPPIDPEQLPLLRNLLDQVALAMDRARAESRAQDMAANHARDGLRSALLGTIAQDLLPSTRRIHQGLDQLRRTGVADKAPISEIGAETAKLDRYIANLADLGLNADPTPIEAGPISIDLFHRTVSREGKQVHLPPKEYALLAELAKHPGRVLSHAHLLRTVWGPAHESQLDYLRVAVRGLRQKLEAEPSRPRLILNEPTIGYRLLAARAQ